MMKQWYCAIFDSRVASFFLIFSSKCLNMKKGLAAKLKIKDGHSLLILYAPDDYLSSDMKADRRLKDGKQYDFIQWFVKRKVEIDKEAARVIKALKREGILWISYPKKTSLLKSDITRDSGWDAINRAGFETVSQISIDETWSALRFSLAKNESPQPAKKIRKFTAVLQQPDDGIDGAFVSIPFDVKDEYGSSGQVKVKALFDGYPYRGILANMGTGCHVIIVRKDIRHAIGKQVGEKISVTIEPDTEERVVIVPQALRDALAESPKAEAFFNSLSFTNRKEYAGWISSAKRPETVEKRLSETIRKLLAGKKNPSQP
jgi:hypothetical protein